MVGVTNTGVAVKAVPFGSEFLKIFISLIPVTLLPGARIKSASSEAFKYNLTLTFCPNGIGFFGLMVMLRFRYGLPDGAVRIAAVFI